MRVAHIVCRYPPYNSGMGNAAHEQVFRLSQNHQLVVFSLDTNLKPIIRFCNSGFCTSLLSKLKNFDIINLHYPFYGAQEIIWLGKILGILKKPKLVIYYHMDAVLTNPFQKIAALPAKLIKNSLFNQADKIVCSTIDYVRHSNIGAIYKKHPDKFVAIPFGTEVSPVKYSRKDLGVVEEKKIILFVGGLDRAHYFKGVDILLKAASTLKNNDFRLIIVGDGDLKSQYQKQAQESGLKDKVIFTGRVEDNKLSSYYHACDLFVLPSVNKSEAFGIVLIEAKAFGKAVIGSDLPGVRQVVGDNVSGLTVRPGDVDDLAHKIKTLLENDELRHKFGQAGKKQVEQKYNWDVHVKKLEQIYNNC